jgi:predicted phage gp36 major capsid-like protein
MERSEESKAKRQMDDLIKIEEALRMEFNKKFQEVERENEKKLQEILEIHIRLNSYIPPASSADEKQYLK